MARTPHVLAVVLAGLCVLLVGSAAAQARATPRIIGGSDGDIARTPWMAALLERGEPASDSQFCGGAVVAPQVVVTAAHCVFDASANDVDVLTGTARLSGGGERIQVASIKVHPRYNDKTSHDDIAVLLLRTPTTATPLAVASAATAALGDGGKRLLIEGWGATGNQGGGSNTLLEGTQVIRGNSTCERAWEELYDARTQFCATGSGGGRPDTCPGDSGGPLTGSGADGVPRLVGVVSFGGNECGVANPPSVYTRVSTFSGWVAQAAGLAPAPNPTPTPEPPAQTGKVKLKFGRMECGITCRVQVQLSGDGAMSVTALDIRAIGPGGRFDKTIAARRVGARSWRSQIDLPFGKDRIVATAFDRDGKPVGNTAKTTITIVPA